jgi:GT2 family glycosyltransferase
MPAPDLSIVIVSHRTCDDVRRCLDSLFTGGGLDGVAAEVLLIDNVSDDGTVEMTRREFPTVRVFETGENIGFARANNRGIAAAEGRLVLLLNPDTLVPAGALARCVAFLDRQDDRVAGMTCRVESPDGSLQWTCSRRVVTPWSECCRALGLDRLFPKSDLFNPEPMVGWKRAETRAVDCLLGAFMLLRQSALAEIGGLDESFFLMYEDADWCRRAHDRGYRLLFWPGAKITHIGGQSWKQDPIRTFAASHESALIYFRKHHPRSLGVVRAVSRFGMALKIALLRARLLRRPNDDYALEHLEMAHAAQAKLQQDRP